MPDLYPHQRAELDFLQTHPRALQLSDVGTGKTPVFITYAAHVMEQDGRVLLVTEKGLICQTMREAEAWLPKGLPRPVEWGPEATESRFAITTHTKAANAVEALCALRPTLLIVDEAQIVRRGGTQPESVTYSALRRISEHSERAVFATASPVSSTHALELLALEEAACLPGVPARAALAPHIVMRDVPNEWGGTRSVPDGITEQGLAMLMEPLRKHAIRHTVHQVGRGALPTLIVREPINVSLTAEEAAAYEAADGSQGLQRYHARTRVSRSARGLVPATVHYLTESEGTTHRKKVIFTENKDVFDPLLQALQRQRVPVWTIDGDMSAKQRDDSVTAWRRAHDGALLGTGAVETGLNLQAGSLLVTVVQSWNPERERQREGRLVRVGSRHSTVVHQVIRPDVTLESWKVAKHERNERIAEQVMAAVRTSHPAGANHV